CQQCLTAGQRRPLPFSGHFSPATAPGAADSGGQLSVTDIGSKAYGEIRRERKSRAESDRLGHFFPKARSNGAGRLKKGHPQLLTRDELKGRSVNLHQVAKTLAQRE